jgi:hypothetical protein
VSGSNLRRRQSITLQPAAHVLAYHVSYIGTVFKKSGTIKN